MMIIKFVIFNFQLIHIFINLFLYHKKLSRILACPRYKHI